MEEQAIKLEDETKEIIHNTETRICYWKSTMGIWCIYLPKCGMGNLRNHQIEEHGDGTISVTPSILMYGHDHSTTEKTNRHGYLTKGIWREC